MMSEKAFRSVTNISTTLSDLSSDNAESLESPPPPDSPLSREGTVASERAESAKPSTDVGDDAMPKETSKDICDDYFVSFESLTLCCLVMGWLRYCGKRRLSARPISTTVWLIRQRGCLLFL